MCKGRPSKAEDKNDERRKKPLLNILWDMMDGIFMGRE